MLPLKSSLENIVSPFKAILLDAYGVFWAGGSKGLFPGAKETMRKLVLSGKKVGVLSNTAQLSENEVAKVGKYGLFLGEHFHFFLTSGEIAKEFFSKEELSFSSQKKRVWVFGKDNRKLSSHLLLFEDSLYQETQNLSEADLIYVEKEAQIDPFLFQKKANQIQAYGIPVVCLKTDELTYESEPKNSVFYMGKPEKAAYQAAMRCFLALDLILPEHVLMIGDTPEIDIRGAKKAGMASTLVVETGIMGDRVQRYGLDAVIDSCLPQDRPDFLIERFFLS